MLNKNKRWRLHRDTNDMFALLRTQAKGPKPKTQHPATMAVAQHYMIYALP